MGILKEIAKIFQKEKYKIKELQIKTNFKKENIEIELSEEFSEIDDVRDLINQWDTIEISKNNILKIQYDDIYEFYYDEFSNEINIYELLKLPPLFRGIVEIENKNNFLVDKEVRYPFRFKFLDESYIIKNENILESEATKELKLMTKSIYDLIKELMKYNMDKERVSDSANQFEMLKIIKDSSVLNDIKISERLKREETPVIIEKIKIDCEDDGKVLKIYPKLDEDEEKNKEILKSIGAFDEARKDYSVKLEDKKVRYIIKNKESLEKVLNNNEVTGQKRLDMLSGKDELFEDDNIDVSGFGPRVTGIGYLKYRSSGGSGATNDLDWIKDWDEFPYFSTSNLEGDFEKIILKPEHKTMLQKKLCELEKENFESIAVEFKLEDESTKKIIMNKEEIEQEILNLNRRIKGLEEVKDRDLKKLVDKEADGLGYIHYKGQYIFVGNEDYKSELDKKIEKLEQKELKKEKTLLIADNFEETDYKEEICSKNKLSKAIMPKCLRVNITLFDYQEECVRKLQEVYINGSRNGFLLCDDMGLGKTLQLLTFMGWLKEKERLSPSLIVAPSSLLNNWDNSENGEIQKFFNEGSFTTEKVTERVTDERLEKLKNADIVFITYESLRSNNLQLGKVNWKVMICDEAQKIKNPVAKVTVAAKAQNVDFKIICSATPIENSLEDLWCLVDYSKPGLFGSLKDFRKEYINNKELDYQALNDELYGKLEECYIRREKDVLPKELPKKVIKLHKIQASELEYDAIEMIKETEEYTLTAIQKMLALSSHIDIFSSEIVTLKNIDKFIQRSSKLKEVLKIIKTIEEKKEKVIVFTRSKKIQQMLYYAIKLKFNQEVAIVNGETKLNKRTNLINEFRKSVGFDLIILSPEVAGFGITITEANHVIHYTRLWNPAKEDQATDRAYRIGQTKEVSVYYPILTNGKSEIKEYREVMEYVKDNKEKVKLASPEDNLNILIARKKDMLINFFLAGGAIEVGIEEFKELDEKPKKRKLTLEDIKKSIYSEKEKKRRIADIYREKGYVAEINNGEYGEDILIKDKKDNIIKAIILVKEKNKCNEKIQGIKEKYKNEKISIEEINIYW